jgi:hypothetical protein
MDSFITPEILTKVYNKIKNDSLTNEEYAIIMHNITPYRTKEHIDEYIQRIKNGSESLDDFLGKVQRLG